MTSKNLYLGISLALKAVSYLDVSSISEMRYLKPLLSSVLKLKGLNSVILLDLFSVLGVVDSLFSKSFLSRDLALNIFWLEFSLLFKYSSKVLLPSLVFDFES